jgi:hypothetical protein
LVQQKVWKTMRLHASTKAAHHCLCWCCFSHKFFQLLVEQTNLYYQQHLKRQARPSHWLPDIMTLTALALQMGYGLKDTLHDYLTRLRQLHTPFYGETMTWYRFSHVLRFLHFADNSGGPDGDEEYDRLLHTKSGLRWIL